MQKLINNRLFRIVGMIVILYYALFHDKTNPESLGSRLAPEKVKSNLQQISGKSVDIIENIQKVDEFKKIEASEKNIQKPNQNEQQKQ